MHVLLYSPLALPWAAAQMQLAMMQTMWGLYWLAWTPNNQPIRESRHV